MREHEATIFIDGIGFPESPRWHDGRLWFSDFHTKRVHTLDLHGRFESVCELPHVPSGIGWLPDDTLLVVSMEDRKLMRLDGDDLAQHADLSHVARYSCNDMVVDAFGRAYVGNFGFNYAGGERARSTGLALVTRDGVAQLVAQDLLFPNGAVISPDGRTFIIAETFGARLTAFDILPGGGLTNRRVFADFREKARKRGRFPDGICLDAEGAVWVASPSTNECVRVLPGGEITDRVSTGDINATACMLGGWERSILFICAGRLSQERMGRILWTQVEVPGAGLP